MLRSLPRRWMAPAVVAAAAALVLTGCGSSKSGTQSKPKATATPTAAAAVDPCHVKGGGTSASVTASGAFGKKDPTLTFAKGLSAKTVERTITPLGKIGTTTVKGETINVQITAYNGRTGQRVSSESLQLPAGDQGLPPAIDAGLDCVPLGSRVITTFPSSELYGNSGNANFNIEPGDSMVVLTDVLSVYHVPTWSKAPKVTFKKGLPQFTLTGKPASTLMLHLITKGNGAMVGSNDTVTVKYYGVSWNTKRVFDQNFGPGKQPASFPVSGVVKGFGAALRGETVGSKILVTMPPQDAYGAGKINKTNKKDLTGQTLVFYIEILSTKSA